MRELAMRRAREEALGPSSSPAAYARHLGTDSLGSRGGPGGVVALLELDEVSDLPPPRYGSFGSNGTDARVVITIEAAGAEGVELARAGPFATEHQTVRRVEAGANLFKVNCNGARVVFPANVHPARKSMEVRVVVHYSEDGHRHLDCVGVSDPIPVGWRSTTTKYFRLKARGTRGASTGGIYLSHRLADESEVSPGQSSAWGPKLDIGDNPFAGLPVFDERFMGRPPPYIGAPGPPQVPRPLEIPLLPSSPFLTPGRPPFELGPHPDLGGSFSRLPSPGPPPRTPDWYERSPWTHQKQAPAITTLTAPVRPGDFLLPVQDTFGFCVGQQVVIDEGCPQQEVGEIAGFGSLALRSPLRFYHPPGAPVLAISQAPMPLPRQQIVEILHEVPRPEHSYVDKPIEVPEVRYVEKLVEVPRVQIQEVVRPVPRVHVQEMLREVPRIVPQVVERAVEVPQIEYVDRTVEVPHLHVHERFVETPEVHYQEVIRPVPRIEVQEVERIVPRPVVQTVDRMVPVPDVQVVERFVDVPEVHYQEIVRQVPRAVFQEAIRQVPRVETQIVEKIVEVPSVQVVEKIVEVPEVEIQEVIVPVPKVEVREIIRNVPKYTTQFIERLVEVPSVEYATKFPEVPHLHYQVSPRQQVSPLRSRPLSPQPFARSMSPTPIARLPSPLPMPFTSRLPSIMNLSQPPPMQGTSFQAAISTAPGPRQIPSSFVATPLALPPVAVPAPSLHVLPRETSMSLPATADGPSVPREVAEVDLSQIREDLRNEGLATSGSFTAGQPSVPSGSFTSPSAMLPGLAASGSFTAGQPSVPSGSFTSPSAVLPGLAASGSLTIGLPSMPSGSFTSPPAAPPVVGGSGSFTPTPPTLLTTPLPVPKPIFGLGSFTYGAPITSYSSPNLASRPLLSDSFLVPALSSTAPVPLVASAPSLRALPSQLSVSLPADWAPSESPIVPGEAKTPTSGVLSSEVPLASLTPMTSFAITEFAPPTAAPASAKISSYPGSFTASTGLPSPSLPSSPTLPASAVPPRQRRVPVHEASTESSQRKQVGSRAVSPTSQGASRTGSPKARSRSQIGSPRTRSASQTGSPLNQRGAPKPSSPQQSQRPLSDSRQQSTPNRRGR